MSLLLFPCLLKEFTAHCLYTFQVLCVIFVNIVSATSVQAFDSPRALRVLRAVIDEELTTRAGEQKLAAALRRIGLPLAYTCGWLYPREPCDATMYTL